MDNRLARFQQLLGTVFHIGSLPIAPGTWGSLFALAPIYLLGVYSTYGVLALALSASLVTLWVSASCEKRWGKDPSNVVMDELAGQALALAPFSFHGGLYPDLLLLAAGFILFRFFDILKPLGIGKTQRLSGGPGILLDDLIAGIYAFITIKICIFTAEAAGIM